MTRRLVCRKPGCNWEITVIEDMSKPGWQIYHGPYGTHVDSFPAYTVERLADFDRVVHESLEHWLDMIHNGGN